MVGILCSKVHLVIDRIGLKAEFCRSQNLNYGRAYENKYKEGKQHRAYTVFVVGLWRLCDITALCDVGQVLLGAKAHFRGSGHSD